MNCEEREGHAHAAERAGKWVMDTYGKSSPLLAQFIEWYAEWGFIFEVSAAYDYWRIREATEMVFDSEPEVPSAEVPRERPVPSADAGRLYQTGSPSTPDLPAIAIWA